MKLFNVTAQVYRLHDPHKQHLLINDTVVAKSNEDAIAEFKHQFTPNIEYQLVKIHSAEEIPQAVA